MKKLITLTLALTFVLALSGCNKDNPSTNKSNNTKSNNEVNCFTLCNETIPEKCEDEIVEYEANDVPVMTNDTIYNNEFCETQCNSWTDEVMQCVSNAKSCEQLGPEAEYCITNPPEDPFEYPEENENAACDKACNNYADCAGLTPDATGQDLKEAYNSCYSECQGWSEETIKCMSNANGKTANGCMTISMCGLQQYQGMMNQ